MPKILAIAGSFREHAYSKRVLTCAANGARAAGAEVTIVDLREYPMPIFDQDIQDKAFDETALRLQNVIAEHDGFLLSTPEYNGSIPGGFKNVIDWTSRKNDTHEMYGPVKGKIAAMISSSPGQFGGIKALQHLRGVLTQMGVHVLPFEISVPFVSQKFDGDSTEMTDGKTNHLLENAGASLVEALRS